MWEYLQRTGDYQKWFGQLRASRYIDFPFEVSIETMSLCNARCEFCPYPGLKRKGAVLSDELIMKVLKECREIPSDLPFQLNFSRVNETFLDKRIYDIRGWANRELPNAGFVFFSNGSPLNEAGDSQCLQVGDLAQ